jgi:hypothetical protein
MKSRGIRVGPGKSKAKNSNMPQSKKTRPRTVTTVTKTASHRLDEAAQRWLKLIRDPCGADLTVPCYAGTGEGYLIRCKDIVNIPATAVDGVYEFTPPYYAGSNVRYSWANAVGGGLGTAENYYTNAFLQSAVVGRFRPVAACVKVYYIGAELDRKGSVGLNLSAGRTIEAGEAIAGTASSWLTSGGFTGRTPKDHYEVKWAPCEGDSAWWPKMPDESEIVGVSNTGNSMTVAFTGVPAGSLRLEYTTIYEWQPSEEVSQGLVTSAKGPSSRNHINEILYALGEIGKFAYGQVLPRVPQLAQFMLA